MIFIRKIVGIAAVLAVSAFGVARAQTTSDRHTMGPEHMQQMTGSGDHPMGAGHMQEMMRQHQGMPMGGHSGMHGASTTPTLPGQDAFGAIQEVVRILEADPKT